MVVYTGGENLPKSMLHASTPHVLESPCILRLHQPRRSPFPHTMPRLVKLANLISSCFKHYVRNCCGCCFAPAVLVLCCCYTLTWHCRTRSCTEGGTAADNSDRNNDVSAQFSDSLTSKAFRDPGRPLCRDPKGVTPLSPSRPVSAVVAAAEEEDDAVAPVELSARPAELASSGGGGI